MERLVVLIVLTVVAVVAAIILQRRRPEPPSAPSYRAPTQVDRSDFDFAAKPWLIAVFTSATCDGCKSALETASTVANKKPEMVAWVDLEVSSDPRLHQRYRIDGVPTTLVVDQSGVVAKAFFGSASEEALLSALELEN